MSVEGNTHYIDTEGNWNTFEGQLKFDPEKASFMGCAVSENLDLAAYEKDKGGYEQGVSDDTYRFAASYIGMDGTGIRYNGHTAALIFDVKESCTVTLTTKKKEKEITIAKNLESAYAPPCNSPEPSETQDPSKHREHIITVTWIWMAPSQPRTI